MIRTLPAPIRVSLDLTSVCNLRCRHCRHGTLPGPEIRLDFDQIRRIVDDAAQMGVFRLTFSGGEPTLRADLVEILAYALGSSRIGRVFLSTNGQYLGRHNLQRLIPFQDRLTFKISLDGPASLHDRLRGRDGCCSAARAAIVSLVAQGFEAQVTTTLMRENLPYVAELLAWSANACCSRHTLVEVIPVGAATPDLVLTPDERELALGTVRQAKARYQRDGYTILAKLPFAPGDSLALRCTGGTEECGILTDGSVVGCRLLPDLVEGNVKATSLREIWGNPQGFAQFRHLPLERLSAPCRACPLGATCLGGCHAFARAVTGDFFQPDGRCSRAARVGQRTRKETPCWVASC
jgi:radical SAM protein with 4Fe4S-binding SPASM domain